MHLSDVCMHLTVLSEVFMQLNDVITCMCDVMWSFVHV